MSGSLPHRWKEATIGELCIIKVAQAAPTPEQPVPYIEISSINTSAKEIQNTKDVTAESAPTRARQWVESGDVLVSMTRPNLNAVAMVPVGLDGAVCSTGFDVLRATRAVPKWLFYAVQTADFVKAMTDRVQGVVYPAVRPKDVRDYRVPLPSLSEQERIVGAIETHFTRLDAAVATLKYIQANLKRFRASVLKAAVEGRLVPTEAELARREGRDYEPASELLKHILDERRRRWEEAEFAKLKARGKPLKDNKWKSGYKEPLGPSTSELPALPEGWCWATWSQVGLSQNGRAFPSKEYQPTGVKLLRPGNLHASGRVEWTESNTRRLPAYWAKEYPSHVVGPNELVMNLTAQSLKEAFLGRVCRTSAAEYCLLNQRIARLTPILLDESYLLAVFQSPLFRRFVGSLNTGSLIQHMFTSQLAEFALPVPPLAEQERIVATIEKLEAGQREAERVTGATIALSPRFRQAILGWAFAGKLAAPPELSSSVAVLQTQDRGDPLQMDLT